MWEGHATPISSIKKVEYLAKIIDALSLATGEALAVKPGDYTYLLSFFKTSAHLEEKNPMNLKLVNITMVWSFYWC